MIYCKDCKIVVVEEVTYPYKKLVSGVSLVDEVELLRQSIFELKNELCVYNKNYSWCK